MRLPVPKALRNRLKPTPQWLAITLQSQQTPVRVTVVTRGAEIDVTDNNAIAALHPLTIRLGLHAHLNTTVEREIGLRFVDRTTDRTLGTLQLTYLREWRTAGARLGLFEVTGGRHRCAGWPRRAWDTWMYERAARRIPPERQMMPSQAVEQLMVFNLSPRPVFFVAVDDGRNSNLFPMDLVGPMAPEHFTLALRNTSPSVATIKNARRLVIADVPGDAAPIAHRLGAHHREQNINFESLPFEVRRSQRFSLPVPAIAARAREIEIFDFQTVGSHTLFVGRICTEQVLGSGARLFHTSGIHQRFRAKAGRAFAEASPTTAA
ncbi:MAG TPA: flavin reductase [Steroidobacteraceae bacterium]|nr:flavin reductase [Steroidobacteraceae bacterium]